MTENTTGKSTNELLMRVLQVESPELFDGSDDQPVRVVGYDIRHIIPSRDFFTISKTSMGYVPTVYYQCFIEPDDSCSETDKLLHLKVRIKPDVAHNGRIARLYPEESEQAAIDEANRAIGRLRTILGRC